MMQLRLRQQPRRRVRLDTPRSGQYAAAFDRSGRPGVGEEMLIVGSIGGMELVLVLVVALLLFGPRKLPQIGRTIGKAMSELRKASRDFKMNLDREVGLDEVRQVGRDLREARGEVSETIDEVSRTGSGQPPAPVPRASGPDGPESEPVAGDGPGSDATSPRKD
jgi:Tat protein translocase TatB subunit